MVEVGMAVQKSTHANKGSRLGIMYILHPYYFSLKYHYLKSSRDVTYTLSLAYYPYSCTFLNYHPYFNHQFYSIVFYACASILASSPCRLSTSSLYYTCDLFIRETITHAREGESLGGFDHVRTLMTHSTSTVSTYVSPKERERRPDQCVLRIFGVLYR